MHESWAPASMTTDRLVLEPLQVAHAEEMVPLLDDPSLHTFIGGSPATLDELRDRYARLESGASPDGCDRWLNWIVRRRADRAAVGTVQATIIDDANGTVAHVAWVAASRHQGHGYATEAAVALLRWLRRGGPLPVVAYIHPEHEASMAVARSLSMQPTDRVVDGEIEWRAR